MSLNKKHFILFLLLCFSSAYLSAQNKQFDKANKKYDLKKYAEAIPLYEQGLKIDHSIRAMTRLAFCHRMTNNVSKAEELYQEVVNHKRAKPITWLYYGETLMMSGKYTEAKKWFEKYTENKPGDNKGWEMITQLEQMQSIKPYFKNTKTEPFEFNSEADDSAPLIYNNTIVFSSDRKQGVKLLKQKSGWTGRDFINIYQSELKEDGAYDKPKAFPNKINATNKNCGNPTFSPDGKMMVFSRNSDWATKRGDYNIMLFSAELTDKGKWKNVEMLSFCNLNANYMHPAFSVTGDTLFYISNRPGGEGGTDIFYSYKKGSKWTRPKNLSDKINTTSNEGYPFVDANGKLFFCSKGHTGYGGFDIFYAEQNEDGDWQTPVNVGFPINSSHDDISIYVAEDEQSGMFASSRDGGDDDIYFFTTNNLHVQNGAPLVYRPEKDVSEEISNEEVVIEEVIETKQPFEELSKETLTEPANSIESINEIASEEFNTNEKILIEQSSEELSNENSSVSIEPRESKVITDEELMKEELIDLIPIEKEPLEEIEVLEQDSNYSKMEGEEMELVPVKEEIVTNAIEKSEIENPDVTITEETTEVEIPAIVESRDEIPVEYLKSNASLDKFLSNKTLANNSVFILENIKFSPDQFKITDEIAQQIQPLVEVLQKNNQVKLEIGAHTESIGDDKKNMVLSIKRATAIAGYLIRNGVDKNQLQVMGYGETQLVNQCSNDITCTQEEHFENHRIELKVIEK